MIQGQLDRFLTEVRQRLESATTGPAEKWLDDRGQWHIRFPNIPRGFGGGTFGFLTLANEEDAELHRAAYTDFPRLLELVDLLKAEVSALYADLVSLATTTVELRGQDGSDVEELRELEERRGLRAVEQKWTEGE